MAYTINTGSVVLVTFRGTLFGQDVMNTFHYRWDGPVLASGLTALIALIGTNPQMQANMALWQNCISEDVVDCRVIGQWIFPLRYRQYNTVMAAPTGSGSPCGTANVASVITLVADRASRHGVGNKHLPGLPLSSQEQGFLTNGQKVANTDFANAMAATVVMLGGIFQPVIYNRVNPAASMEVIGAEENLTVRVQRRRTVGLGK